MAKELNLTLSVSFSKNGVTIPNESRTFQIDVAGANAALGSQAVTSAADVQVQIPAAISSVGHLIIINTGSTPVQFSYATGGSFDMQFEVPANDFAKLKPKSSTIYAKAVGSDSKILTKIVEP